MSLLDHQLYAMLSNKEYLTIAVEDPELGLYARSYTTSGVVQTKNPALDSLVLSGFPMRLYPVLSTLQDVRNQILFKKLRQQKLLPKRLGMSSAYDKAEPMLSINTVRKRVLISLYTIILAMAIIGLISTTLVHMDERRKELALLRSLGMSTRSITTLVSTEQFITSAVFVLFGCGHKREASITFFPRMESIFPIKRKLWVRLLCLYCSTRTFSWIWMLLSIIGTIFFSILPPVFFVWKASLVSPIELFGTQR